MKFLTAVVVVSLSSAAFAQSGALLSPSALDGATRSKFAAEIAAAKKADPAQFEAVTALRGKLAVLDERKRGGIVPVGMMLKPMGASAFWPLVEQAAFNSPPRADLTDSAWRAWRVGVLEALGMLRNERALPLFTAVLADVNVEADITRAAAEAAGRLGSDSAAKLLVKLSSDPRVGLSVQKAMGNCRRLMVAQSLAALADRVTDEEQARELARSLGDVGNSWAWKTPVIAKAATEEGAVRQVAAEALVRLFVRFSGPGRQAASNALMVVDAPTTETLIASASAEAPESTKVALTGLRERFARNPAR